MLLLCWNHEKYIEQCLDTVASQTCRDFEIILLDNLSQDRSVEIARRVLDKSGLQYRIIENEEPQGISPNLNKLLAHARSDLVSVLSTDDWYAPRYAEAMLEAANNHPQTAWFSSGGWVFTESTGEYEAVEKSRFAGKDVATSQMFGEQPFFAGHCYRRTELEAIGGWDTTQVVEDADLFFRLSKRTPHWIVDEKLVYYRRHESSFSFSPDFMERALESYFAKHADAFPNRARGHRSKNYRLCAVRYADLGQGESALRVSLKAIRLRPWTAINWRTLFYALRVLVRSDKSN